MQALQQHGQRVPDARRVLEVISSVVASSSGNSSAALVGVLVIVVALLAAGIIMTIVAKRDITLESTLSDYDLRAALIMKQVAWRRIDDEGDLMRFQRRSAGSAPPTVVAVGEVEHDPSHPLSIAPRRPGGRIVVVSLTRWGTRLGMIMPLEAIQIVTFKRRLADRIVAAERALIPPQAP